MTPATARRRVSVILVAAVVALAIAAATGEAASLRRGGGRGSSRRSYGDRIGGRRGGLHNGRTGSVQNGRAGSLHNGRASGGQDGRTGVVVAFETPDQEQFQYGRPGEAVFGAFSWTSPEGVLVVMRYVADAAGYRVVGGPVPRDSRGVAAGGEQVFPRAADGSLILT